MTSDDPFDPGNLTLPQAVLASAPRLRRREPRPRKGEPFLKGPIPWPWLEAAARLPNQALAAGLALWFEAGCRKKRTVRMTHDRLTRFGMSLSTAHRALQRLVDAELIVMTLRPGGANEITILDVATPVAVSAAQPSQLEAAA